VLTSALVPASQAVPAAGRADELQRARHALAAAGAELEALAGRLRADGRPDEAEIVATGALMAADPALDAAVERHAAGGLTAAAAVLEACGEHADAIAALGDDHLAARAEDVRSLGRRAARLAQAPGTARDEPAATPLEPVVLVAHDLGPADVAELDAAVAAVALVAGTPTGHAAVVARGLGIPLAVGLGPALLDAGAGEQVAVDGDAGTAVLAPSAATLAAAYAGHRRQAAERARSAEDRALPAITRDGRRVRVLVNAATVAELEAGLAAGAEGVGLLRTELGFLDAVRWPDEAAHRRLLAPLLARLEGRTATVRVLDFGGDKAPPFLNGTSQRGLALLLAAPDALAAQLRAIAAAGGATDLRVLLPIAEHPGDVESVRAMLADIAPALRVAIGAMVETVAAVEGAEELAKAADFLSIGTNDLAHAATGSDRFAPAGAATPVHDPRVLALVARTAEAARAAGVLLEVCGDAASDPIAVPLLVGLGVDELSVGAARVGRVRAWVRGLEHAAVQRAARAALAQPGAAEVEALVGALVPEAGDAAGKRRDGRGSVVPVGPQA
jgi:phosphoenolpyruvate-protein kinase (PTS system EI component)